MAYAEIYNGVMFISSLIARMQMKFGKLLDTLAEEKEQQPEVTLILKMSLALLAIIVAAKYLSRYLCLLFVILYFLYHLSKKISASTGYGNPL